MSPVDAEAYIKTLSTYGLEFLVDGKARDLAVVDQLRGPLAPCDWIVGERQGLTRNGQWATLLCRSFVIVHDLSRLLRGSGILRLRNNSIDS